FTNAILQIDIAEEFARPHIAAAHASLQKTDKASESRRKPPGQLLFQQPARSRFQVRVDLKS
ncbi:hypothetical protein, partial [Sinorhizobium medicae]|uniref:hypothetical protein n=1 Tax=Sinorhizobium medicae TaxID=110321 RepID=UPI00047692C3